MAKFYNVITPALRDFIEAQQMFFTASATTESRVNLSPKGIDTLRILDDATVAYLDLTGSGNETAAHLKADGRLTIMVCSFGKAAMILRLYGRGRLVFPRDAEWATLHGHFPTLPGERQIVLLDVEAVQTSCGFGVPRYKFVEQRETLPKWAAQQGEAKMEDYRREKNSVSIDGLPSDTVAAQPVAAD